MRKIFVLFVFCIVFTSCETRDYGNPLEVGKIDKSEIYPWNGLNKSEIKAKYFKNKTLDAVEGIYLGTDGKYEIAIIKNNTKWHSSYDYIGIIVDTTTSNWNVGDIKIYFKKTNSSAIFPGIWRMGDGSKVGRSFIFREDYFEINLPTGYNFIDQKWLHVKTYPNAKSTKKSISKSKKREASSGSAFFINNDGYVITNHHVIESCNDNLKIVFSNNNHKAKLIAKDEYLDLALLKAEIKNDDFIELSVVPPKKLQKIIAAGYPFGKYLSDDLKFTSGIVSSLKGLKDDSTRLQIDAALNPGNSGGPIVDEQTGRLVAVAVAGLRKDITESVNFGIKANSVKSFLDSNNLNYRLFKRKFNSKDISTNLENSVVYIFCK